MLEGSLSILLYEKIGRTVCLTGVDASGKEAGIRSRES
jgi:hypothetical protein